MKGNKVLIAEDDAAILDVMQMILEEAGYDVETSLDGTLALNMNENLPDLLLLDIRMSGRDGRGICQYLKAQEQTRHIPIIMVSANKDVERIALEAGADDFISKPFEMAHLIAKVEQYLGEPLQSPPS